MKYYVASWDMDIYLYVCVCQGMMGKYKAN